MFKLQEDVWEVDAEGVVARQVELLPALARRTRHSGSAKSLWQLSDEETTAGSSWPQKRVLLRWSLM